MAVPVYVIHYRAPEWCRDTVKAIEASSVEVAVTVIDNSGDFDGDCPIIRPGRNLGYAGGGNVALGDVNSEWCLICCHDVYPEPETIGHLLDARRPPYVALSPIINGGLHEWVVAEAADGDIIPASSAHGTMMLINVAAARSVGGFDEAFGSYGEENDLCRRLNEAGHRVGYVADASVSARGTASPRAELLKRSNKVLLALKGSGWPEARRQLGILARDAVRADLRLLTKPTAQQRAWAGLTNRSLARAAWKVATNWRGHTAPDASRTRSRA